MRLLIDTHILILALTNSQRRLSKNVVDALKSSENISFVSIITLWEIAIKHSIEKLQVGMSLSELLKLIESSGLSILPIGPEEIITVSQLPFHHTDPFDRLLIAQAITNDFHLISKDKVFMKYDVSLF